MLNYSWRDYGNRVGVWRCLELFDELKLPAAAIINTALYDYCARSHRGLRQARRRAGRAWPHELGTAGRSFGSPKRNCFEVLQGQESRKHSEQNISGWLSPWISESAVTPDLLAETGYRYTLNWCHDDQPVKFNTRSGKTLWSIPYPQELNDIPMIVARQMDARDFADMIVDNFDEMLRQSEAQPLVMGIALHPYLVGQPYRLRHLRRALKHVAAKREEGLVHHAGRDLRSRQLICMARIAIGRRCATARRSCAGVFPGCDSSTSPRSARGARRGRDVAAELREPSLAGRAARQAGRLCKSGRLGSHPV